MLRLKKAFEKRNEQTLFWEHCETFLKARKRESSDKKSEKNQVGEDGCEVSNLNGDAI